MSGGLLQLMVYGRQDVPYRYRRYTNFATESYEFDFNIDDCMTIQTMHYNRKYNNFDIQEISWYKNGNASFTLDKYNKYKHI